MECSQIQDSLSAFLDCEIAPEQAARIELHLEKCAACLRQREALEAQHQRLRALFVERRRAADLMANRVNHSLGERPPVRSFKRWLPLLLSAAAGFLIAVGIFQPWRNSRGPLIPLSTPDAVAAGKGKLALIV